MKYYLSGIAGSGMNVIAQYLASTGNSVFGSDRMFDRSLGFDYKAFLEKKGIRIVPQDGASLDSSFDLCIFSAAVEKSVPDLQKAEELHIPVITRSLFLKDLYNQKKSLGVAGTSGKTTTTGILATIAVESGLDATVFCGGEILQYSADGTGGNFFPGRSSRFICEVDESDKSIDTYVSDIAVITNISEDHMALDEAKSLFSRFLERSKLVIFNEDCPFTREIVQKISSPCMRFSLINKNADIFLDNLMLEKDRMTFHISGKPFSLNMPGLYNAENAAAAIAAAKAMGIPLDKVSQAMLTFQGIKGRFEKIPGKGRLEIIYDFAHNPAKIDSLLASAVSLFPKVIIFFQPHGYGPFRKQLEQIRNAFEKRLRKDDTVIIGKIYDAGGTAERTISSEELVHLLKGRPFRAYYAANRSAAASLITQNASWDCACFVVGARDRTLRDFAFELASL